MLYLLLGFIIGVLVFLAVAFVTLTVSVVIVNFCIDFFMWLVVERD
jgi:hypothetical protein